MRARSRGKNKSEHLATGERAARKRSYFVCRHDPDLRTDEEGLLLEGLAEEFGSPGRSASTGGMVQPEQVLLPNTGERPPGNT